MRVLSRAPSPPRPEARDLASGLGPPIGISIGTNSDRERELGDSAGFLRRGEKSLNRRSYRRAPLIDETPRPPMLRTATRDKDPISTSRSRQGHAASPCLRPPRISLSDISDGKRWSLLDSSAPNQLCEKHSGYILFSRYVFLSLPMRFLFILIYILYLSYPYFYSITEIVFSAWIYEMIAIRTYANEKVNRIKNSFLIIYKSKTTPSPLQCRFQRGKKTRKRLFFVTNHYIVYQVREFSVKNVN